MHVPANVQAQPAFSATGTEWLTEGDIWDCLRLLHDTKYSQALFQASYSMRHVPLKKANLIELLGRDPEAIGPDASVGLKDVLYDSLCLHPDSRSSSPFIVVSDQSHYTTVFVQAQCKTMDFFDPLAHPFSEDIIDAFRSYHRKHDIYEWLLALPSA